MATLAANDQENAVRHLQAGAAGKPLNAGIKGFGAKTPGNKAPKTPFKVPLNDENAVGNAGKSVLQTKGKGSENVLFTSKKGGRLDANAFVTPAGPRTRAPLGMKTTNAKSRAFETPAPLSSAGRTQNVSPRLRRPKVKVHQPGLAQESEDDVPEIEYMPPKEIPLAGDMDDYNIGTVPKISGQAMVRGIWQAYHNPVEDDGRTREQRKFEEEVQQGRKEHNEEMERVFAALMAKDDAETREYYGIKQPRQEAPKPGLKKSTTGPSTIRARSAAAALSPPLKPSHAAPTAAAKSRLPTGLVSGRKGAKTRTEPTASRQASSAATSKSTIGYAQGRAARTGPAARQPLSNVTKPAPFSVAARPLNRSASAATGTVPRPRGPVSRCSSTSTNATLVAPQQDGLAYRTPEDAERELEFQLLMRDDEDEDELWVESFNAQLHGDPFEEEHEGFQLQMPEGF